MTDNSFLISLMTIIITFELTYTLNLTSNLKNVSSVLNDLLKSYHRYHRPKYGGFHKS